MVSDVKTPQRDTGHQLRSRKNVNYATPPLDDDSFEETPETDSVRLQEKPEMEPVRLQYKEYRELRSSTRALAVSFLDACCSVVIVFSERVFYFLFFFKFIISITFGTDSSW